MNDPKATATQIAIVGMACRLPGAATVDQFWQNLCAGVESIRRLTPEEMIAAGLDPESLDDPRHVPFGALIDDIDLFDAPFFGIGAREAALMDPQQRLFLECAWAALEDAGCDASRFDGAIGTFGGANFDSYLTKNLLPADVFEDKAAVLQTILANDKDYLATRVAYKLNLRGPAFTVQSGCSTSLLAVHLASHSLLNYECDMALAGGVAIDIGRAQGYWAHEGSVFSPDGHVRAFSPDARGTVFGNGVAVVALKRLADALDGGDTIHAVILGSAVNNDGSAKVGFTAPSVTGQSAVVVEALADAGVPADSIGYVEAHGTGTPLGDPIEIEALTKAFGRRAPGTARCAVGSVKTNVGHLDSAAGVTGLIKAALALRHGVLPPSLHATGDNPTMPFETSPFFVNATCTEWTLGTRAGVPRRAGVSSFGMGGTNVHVVLQEAPTVPVDPPNRGRQLLAWSARTPSALERGTTQLLDALHEGSPDNLADVAYTLQTGRSVFAHRRTLVADSVADARAALERPDGGRLKTLRFDGTSRGVAFLFPGLGSQYAGMARELYDVEPIFRDAFDQCRDIVRSLTGDDLGGRVFPPAEGRLEDAAAALSQTELAQPALFATEYALAQLWIGWGVRPAAMLGHGLGEYVAACLAGVMPLRDAVRIVVMRGQVPLADAFRGIRLSAPAIPFISNVSGRWIEAEQATNPYYWAEQLRRTVRFADGLVCLAGSGPYHLLEVGPGRTLATLAHQSGDGLGMRTITSLPAATDQSSPDQTMLEAVGQLWQLGVSPDWSAIQGRRRRRRISLPTYAFERARYWIDPPPDDETKETLAAQSMSLRKDPGEWFYSPGWKQTPAAELLSRGTIDAAAARWLVFVTDEPLAARVLTLLETFAQPGRVTVIWPGDRFRALDAGRFAIDPASGEDYARLMTALTETGRRPNRIVHLWAGGDDARDGVAVRRAQDTGAFSLLALTRALEATGGSGRVSIRIVTSHVQDVLGIEPLSLAAATLGGVARVIPQELPHVDLGCIDVDVAGGDGAVPAARLNYLAERIVAEVTSRVRDPFVAYRGASRFVPSYEPIGLDAVRPGSALRQRGTYVILGGLGRIGLTLAEHLARSAKAQLVLVGRTPLPARETWTEWLSLHGDGDLVSQRIRRVIGIEALGADVLLVGGDIARVDQLERAFASAERSFGAVHGVIAAAGIVDGAFRAITVLTPAEFERQFRPKVDGLFALEEVLESRPVDFCLVVSSLSSVLGGLGYGAYAAANTFMDAFVRRHNRTSATRWLSANWDAWRWTEAGRHVPGAALAQMAMRPDEATQVFDTLLSIGGSADQIVISTSNLQGRLDQWVESVGARQGAEPGRAETATEAAPLSAVATIRDDRLLTPTQRAVVDTWAHVLGLPRVELQDGFLDIGGSSLTAVQALSRLEQTLGVHVAIEEFIFQTAGQLAGLCDRKLAQAQSPEPLKPGGLLRSLRNAVTGKL